MARSGKQYEVYNFVLPASRGYVEQCVKMRIESDEEAREHGAWFRADLVWRGEESDPVVVYKKAP